MCFWMLHLFPILKSCRFIIFVVTSNPIIFSLAVKVKSYLQYVFGHSCLAEYSIFCVRTTQILPVIEEELL
jgi:hypothetical protein